VKRWNGGNHSSCFSLSPAVRVWFMASEQPGKPIFFNVEIAGMYPQRFRNAVERYDSYASIPPPCSTNLSSPQPVSSVIGNAGTARKFRSINNTD
jgi:hypothetical protein